VLRDDAYGMIKWKQAHDGYPAYGMDYGNPDFVRYAESYGARGHRATSIEGFEAQLREALARPGVDLVEVPVDYGRDDALLNREIAELAAAVS